MQKFKNEITAMLLAMLYFAAFIGVLLLVKTLILAEYRIEFSAWSTALVGVLVLAKVVLVLEHAPLGAWVSHQSAWVDVLLRTILYAVGVFVVLLLEKAFEGRQENGGFGHALARVFQHDDMPHVWANTVCLSAALLGYNLLAVIRRHLGTGGLLRLFLSPLPEEPTSSKEGNGQ